ncbi:hypothetical protein KCP75_15935 [Salmonella enterica subsp. enterica]|nr:hypothetical protein KCP75_15935 [Salmonella enterica subsp. enterica]
MTVAGNGYGEGAAASWAVTALFSEYPEQKEASGTSAKHASEYDIWYFFIYYLAVKAMLLADISSQHKNTVS